MAKAGTPAVALSVALLGAIFASPFSLRADEGPIDPPRPVLLADAEGRLARVVIQLPAAQFEDVLPVVRSLLPRLDPATKVDLVCGHRADARQLSVALEALHLSHAERFTIHLEPQVQTPWARDRFLAAANGLGTTTLWLAGGGLATVGGDFRVPRLLAERSENLALEPQPWPLEGGDLVAGRSFVLIGATTARRIRAAQPQATETELSTRLSRDLGRRAIFVPAFDRLPEQATLVDFHLDMLATVLVDDSVLVADLAAGEAVARRAPPPANWLPEPVAKAHVAAPSAREIAHRLDAIVATLRAANIRVDRIPMLALPDRACLVTFNNVLQEETAARPVVYLPNYGAGELDHAARAVYSTRGYRVAPVEVRSLFQWQGAVRCLVNVIERRPVVKE